MAGVAYYYGLEAGTVNAAELESLKRALQWLSQQTISAPYVIVYGDSDLTVRFMNRQAQPRMQKLALRVASCQDIRKALPYSTHILYVPRGKNQLADWLSKVGGCITD